MYHPQQGREPEGRMRPDQRKYMDAALPVVTIVFWVAAVICVALMAVSSYTEGIGPVLSWAIGISLLLVVMSSGVLTWIQFRINSLEDSERGEWTNKMLFYGLVFAVSFFVAFLYLMPFYFAR